MISEWGARAAITGTPPSVQMGSASAATPTVVRACVGRLPRAWCRPAADRHRAHSRALDRPGGLHPGGWSAPVRFGASDRSAVAWGVGPPGLASAALSPGRCLLSRPARPRSASRPRRPLPPPPVRCSGAPLGPGDGVQGPALEVVKERVAAVGHAQEPRVEAGQVLGQVSQVAPQD